MTSIAVGNRRLLRLAKILDTADALHRKRKEPAYSQENWTHPCGTPACALGHYAAHTPSRWFFEHGFPKIKAGIGGSWAATEEFGLSDDNVAEIFSSRGCGGAKTAKQAAKYIRAFVKRRQKAAV